MNLKTTVHVNDLEPKINYNSKLLFLGSCFSKEIGQKVHSLKYKVAQNPCGITFNTISTLSCIKRCISGDSLPMNTLFESKKLYCHQDFHGSFSNPDSEKALNAMNTSLKSARETIQSVDYVIVTIGTAWVFERKSTGEIVNNCHKQDQNEFDRVLLSTFKIEESLIEIRSEIQSFSSKPVKFILTLSPVRHIRDGLVENQRSKATALTAIHNCVDAFDDVFYFPAYELILDELRDYRFYKTDMLHPSELAVDYIFSKFASHCLDEKEKSLRSRISKINASIDHKPIHGLTSAYENFVQDLFSKMDALEKEFSFLNFENERSLLSERLST